MNSVTTPVATLIATLSVGAVFSVVGTCVMRQWSRARGFVDRPGGHKGHTEPVALGGGVAVTLAVVLPVVGTVVAAQLLAGDCPAWLPHRLAIHVDGIVAKTPMALGVIAAMMAMCALGLVDDARPLGPGLKLIVQLAVALFLVVGLDLRLLSHLGWAPSTALSVLWILTLTNSVNFLDNMDGLATGVALIAAAVFGTTSLVAGQLFVPLWCWLLVGVLAGFLVYNFHPASIYLGDAGSLVVGLLLAVLTILTTFADPSQGHRPIGVIAPLVVMAVPLYDTASVFLLRWRSGVAIWTGDRRHFSHRLVRRGMTVRKAVAVIWLATLVTALPALLLPWASWSLAWGIVVQTLLVVALVALLESPGRSG
ncbi:MAG: undecaprenyl/decaprenyl-phosphate alpha-N-acetylglucosaminyl 1-phosphate transferase [Phycisphaerae bacterium]|nr:undecaprenyl/decaprenyl-phosphate alpha-N-acetylglucosaminyl 1-phosphate transferase [Phycisphaerae bacterium]